MTTSSPLNRPAGLLLAGICAALWTTLPVRGQSLDVPPIATFRATAGDQLIRMLDQPATARILNPEIAVLSTDDSNQVVITALAPGQTLLTYRTAHDAPVSERLIVTPRPRGAALETYNLVADIPGIIVYEANKRIVIDGRLSSVSDIERVKKIADTFGDQILNLTRLDTGASNDVIADFIRRNSGVDGLDIIILGETAYLRGAVPNEATRSNVLALARTQVANVMDMLDVRETMIETEVLFIRAEKTKGHNWGKNLLDGSDIIQLQAGLDGSQDYAQNAWSPAAVGITWSASIAPALNALVNAGKAEVVARPRVGTRLGQKGRFLSGGEMYYKVSGEVSGNLESVEYGIDLSVVPQFLADNTICITLTMTLSFPVTQGGTSDLSLDKYTIESTIVCQVGQSIIISGIAEQIENDQNSRTPFLGSIPLVRLLFSNSTRTYKNSEIIAIITPRAMTPELHDQRIRAEDPRIAVLDRQLEESDIRAEIQHIAIDEKTAAHEAALEARKTKREAAAETKAAAAADKRAKREAAAAEKAAAKQARREAAAEKKAAAAADKKARQDAAQPAK
jgi:Flp pilus assembly secretin CpaC